MKRRGKYKAQKVATKTAAGAANSSSLAEPAESVAKLTESTKLTVSTKLTESRGSSVMVSEVLDRQIKGAEGAELNGLKNGSNTGSAALRANGLKKSYRRRCVVFD